MKHSVEKEYGSNKTGVSLALGGLASTVTMASSGFPLLLIALAVVVTVAGLGICLRSSAPPKE